MTQRRDRRAAAVVAVLLGGAGLGTTGAMSAAAETGPVAKPDSYTVEENKTLARGAPGVLANDTDDDGGYLFATYEDAPSHGGLDLSSDGSFVYTPLPATTGLTRSPTRQATAGRNPLPRGCRSR